MFYFGKSVYKNPTQSLFNAQLFGVNPLSQCVPKINNPPVFHIGLSGPQFPTTLIPQHVAPTIVVAGNTDQGHLAPARKYFHPEVAPAVSAPYSVAMSETFQPE